MTLPLHLRRGPHYRLRTVEGRPVWQLNDPAHAARRRRARAVSLFWWLVLGFGALIAFMQEVGVLP